FERGCAGGDGVFPELIIGGNLGHALGLDRLDELRLRGAGYGKLVLDFNAAGPAKYSTSCGTEHRPGGIGDCISERPDDRGVESPYPPARQGIVEFLDAVPFVTGGRDAGDLIDRLFAHYQSCLSGIRAASSALLRLPGRNTKTTVPTKNRVMASKPQLSAKWRIAV